MRRQSGGQTSAADARRTTGRNEADCGSEGKRTAKGNAAREMLLPIAGGAPSKEASAAAN